MDKISIKSKLKSLLPYAALPLLLGLFLLLLADTTSTPTREVHSENGVWDLRDFDFENYNAMLIGEMAYIPNALLTPTEFAARSGEIVFSIVGDTISENYLTSRDIILLPGDGWFTFSRRSTTYAGRQYVNGAWFSDTGRSRPGYSRESEIPDTGIVIFTAQPQNGTIELVQQSSNFVHRQGNRHFAWQVSESAGLIYESRALDFRQGIVMGSFFLLFLLFMLLYFMMGRSRAALCFSLFCLMWFLRVGIIGERSFTVLMPWLDWTTKFRIEYISIPIAAILTLAIIDALFPKILNKIVIRIFYSFAAALIALYMFADTVIMSHAILASYVIFGLGIVYVFAFFVAKVRGINPGQGIFIAGMVLFLLATILDFVFYAIEFFHVVAFDFTEMAVLIFALCAATSVFITTMREAEKAKENEKRLAAENAALDREKRFRDDVMATVSHEMRTPLTVMSVYAEMAVEEIQAGNISEQTLADLATISDESQRLAQLAGNALAMFGRKAIANKNKVPVDIGGAAAGLANLLMPSAKSKNIQLDLALPGTLPHVWGMPAELTRVLWNLFDNALKHTGGGKITVGGWAAENLLTLTITDTGEGMTQEIKSRVFERGFSGTDRTGLGLPLCKEIVQAHGGDISIQSEPGKGCAVAITLPVYTEGDV